MGMHPRWIKADSVYSSTQRTIDRQFIFKPDPVTCNIIGASAARAQMRHPVIIHWLEMNINHEQNGTKPVDDSLEALTNFVLFKQTFHRIMVEEINRYLEREGGMFSTPSRDVECLDDLSVEQQFEYALLNPVKDGLIDSIRHWKGFSSYGALAQGKDPVYTYVDRTAWWKAGGPNSLKPPEAFTKTVRLKYTPLPGTEHLTDGQRQARLRRRVRELEKQYREERILEGKPAMTAARMNKVDHRDRPTKRAKRTPKPLCHASTGYARESFKKAHRAFLDAYRAASAAYRDGAWNTEFPAGSFRPPLIVAAG